MTERETPQEIRERVEELVYAAEQEGLERFVREHGSKNKRYFDRDLIAHHLACSGRKAQRVKKLLEQRYEVPEPDT